MKRSLVCIWTIIFALKASAQKVDSLYFNLYTDSLKKGTYNYINVEGRYSNGRYLPLGEKDVAFSASAGVFSGNSLFIDSSFKGDRVRVSAVLLADSAQHRQITIYVKKHDDFGPLPTVDEIMQQPRRRRW